MSVIHLLQPINVHDDPDEPEFFNHVWDLSQFQAAYTLRIPVWFAEGVPDEVLAASTGILIRGISRTRLGERRKHANEHCVELLCPSGRTHMVYFRFQN